MTNYFEYVSQTMQLYATDKEYIIIQLGGCKIIIGAIYVFNMLKKKQLHYLSNRYENLIRAI